MSKKIWRAEYKTIFLIGNNRTGDFLIIYNGSAMEAVSAGYIKRRYHFQEKNGLCLKA